MSSSTLTGSSLGAPTLLRRGQRFNCSSSGSERHDLRARVQRSSEASTSGKSSPTLPENTPYRGIPPTRRKPTTQMLAPLATLDDPDIHSAPLSIDPENLSRTVRAVILAGGETRNPLTRYRAMPAVPLGSSLMLIDVPINNCLKSGINKIYVLTQFQSHTLNSHIAASYPPLRFGGPNKQAWVDVLAAQQTVTEKEWYLGSADAIRKNITELKDESRGIEAASDYIILSGSAIYNMDFSQLIQAHRDKNADITIAMQPVGADVAPSKGIGKVHHASSKVMKFEEKPDRETLASFRRDPSVAETGAEYLANMGIYVFKRDALFRLMSPHKKAAVTHIGHHVIPNALAQEMKVYAYQYDNYWRDVSTLRDFYEANLDLAAPESKTRVLRWDGMISAKGSMLPPAFFHNSTVENVVIGDGAVLSGCTVRDSVVGECVYIGKGSVVESSLLLGNGQWFSDKLRGEAIRKGERVYGIGENCELRGCVVDENTTIGNGVKIINREGVREADHAKNGGYMIQDGIVVVMRNATIPDGTVI